MRIVIIYRENSEHARPVIEFKENMRRRYPEKNIEELEIDSKAGATEASLYGIVQYPAIIVSAHEGNVLGQWEGLPLPLVDEVAGAAVELESRSV